MVGVKCAWITSLSLGLALSSAAHGSFLDPFEYAGSEGTLLGLMQQDAGDGQGGAGVFAGAGFGSNMVNVFLADLSNASSGMSNAGMTLFVMWGNGEDLASDYSATISFTDMFNVGEDGVFTDGVSEIFALGEGVTIVDGLIALTANGPGFGSIDPSTETPRGFAITNLQAVDEGELVLAFLLLQGSIQEAGLFNYGDPNPELIDGDLHIPLPVMMPLPPPLGLALAGLIGVVLFRRRMTS